MDTTNPLDPRFGRVPLSSTTSSSTTSHNHLNDTNPLSRVSSHRRVQSETFHRLPEDFLFDLDTDFSLGDVEFPSLSDENGGNSEFCKPSGTDEKAKEKSGVHLRSLSVDAAMFEGLGLDNETVGGGGGGGGEGEVNRRVMHKHSCSMDGSSSLFEPDSMDFVKKAMAADKLAELALLDPKRAKRFISSSSSSFSFALITNKSVHLVSFSEFS